MTSLDRSDDTLSRGTWALRFTRLDWLLLLAVFAVAVFFRLWQQGQVPPGFNFDEAYESLEAHRVLTQPGYHPIYFTGNWGITPLEIYLTALAFRIRRRADAGDPVRLGDCRHRDHSCALSAGAHAVPLAVPGRA